MIDSNTDDHNKVKLVLIERPSLGNDSRVHLPMHIIEDPCIFAGIAREQDCKKTPPIER